MSDMNIGQSSNNFNSQNFVNNSASNAKNADGVNFKSSQNNAMPQTPTPAPTITYQQIAAQTKYINTQLAQLNSGDKGVLLRDLLNLPQNLKDFLLMMTSSVTAETTASQLETLMMNSNLDISKLIQFMQQNGKEALSKLYQMIANFNQMGTSMKTAQLNELSAVINACIPTTGTSQTQMIKNILLLYLPWLPLGEENGFSLEINEKTTGGNGESDDSVTILIATKHFGNVQVVLFKAPQKAIAMQITCSKEFPKNEVEKNLSGEALNYNVQTEIAFEERENFSKTKEDKTKTEVTLNTSPGVNPFLILMAQAVIKTIIGIDKNYDLTESRKEKLDG
ncbi:MAG: hypothetical protein PHV37_04040 [Candidatus Gastranaerophilales bacterium]|nr:hypothetical protein [Candidatus Gastranaerophilales bacterium]